MFEIFKLRLKHGYQAIPDLRKAVLPGIFRGFPRLDDSRCDDSCEICQEICPTDALKIKPLQLDMGRCIFCGDCARECPAQAIEFTSGYRLGNTRREGLIIHSRKTQEQYEQTAIVVRKEIQKLFGRSLKLRQVSAAGCNGCEMELNACGNVNFDMGRFGIDFVASPRHADGIVITGPISANMAPATMDAYKSVSDPKLVILVGACAISGGVFAGSDQLNRHVLDEISIDIFVPGCPTHPLSFIHALLDFMGKK